MLDWAHPCMKESRADGLSCVKGWTKGGMLLSEAVPPRKRVPRRHCRSVKILQDSVRVSCRQSYTGAQFLSMTVSRDEWVVTHNLNLRWVSGGSSSTASRTCSALTIVRIRQRHSMCMLMSCRQKGAGLRFPPAEQPWDLCFQGSLGMWLPHAVRLPVLP